MGLSTLHWADHVVFVGFFGVSLLIGVYQGCAGHRKHSVQEFLTANRRLSVIPTMLSLVMTFISALKILGGVAEMYGNGVSFYCWYTIGLSAGMLTVERLVIPWLFPLKLTSVFEVRS